MSTKLSDEQKQLNKEARATAKTEELMTDVAILSQGDKIIHDGESYVIVSVDSISSHIHVTFPDGTGWTQLAFGTMVDVIAKAEAEAEAEAEEEVVAVTPVQDNPAVTGGRHYK